ncbi:alkaline shock response membrane anchor protein AmaP [Streptomyces sp. 796.1]|uniref:alkaline shock response membrane anchor protein AmaP n=1 Tax=Streptomyces sp. 796.1 TaxID=3163029 RepID=UPI0039C965FD
MDDRPGSRLLNRALLAVLGLSGLTAGTWIAGTGLAARGDLPYELPAWWPRWHPRAELVDWLAATEVRDRGWWPAAVLAALALGLLAHACWLLAQPPRAPRSLPVPTPTPDDAAETPHHTLRTSALTQVMTAQAAGLPGVRRARVRLTGNRRRPRARLTLVLAPDASPRAVLTALTHGPLADAHHSTGLPGLRSGLHLSVASRTARRAR